MRLVVFGNDVPMNPSSALLSWAHVRWILQRDGYWDLAIVTNMEELHGSGGSILLILDCDHSLLGGFAVYTSPPFHVQHQDHRTVTPLYNKTVPSNKRELLF